MMNQGAYDGSVLVDSVVHGLEFWVLAVLPTVIVSFFLLRFRGAMLGRSWIMTDSMRHYLGQAASFREYVRLTQTNRLKFESDELQAEAKLQTRPFGIAFGYSKE